eukprot:scaffold2170_cov140-Skeletonema_marinoi.AAC.2
MYDTPPTHHTAREGTHTAGGRESRLKAVHRLKKRKSKNARENCKTLISSWACLHRHRYKTAERNKACLPSRLPFSIPVLPLLVITSFLPSWVILVCCVNGFIPNQLIIASHFFIHTYHAWLVLCGGWGNIIRQEDLIVCVFVHTASGSRSRNRNKLS